LIPSLPLQPPEVDQSRKTLIRTVPPAFCRLAGAQVTADQIHFTDVSVHLPEFRADQVLIVSETGRPSRWAIHVEYQLQPDTRVLRGWFLKNAALSTQLGMPVLLTVIYLTRARRRTF